MYYILYLSSLCRRRRWPDPLYEPFVCGAGYACNVRVNHRDYQAESIHETEDLAKEAAAMRAYLICRNLSASDSLTSGAAGSLPTGQSQQTNSSSSVGVLSHTGYGSPSAGTGGPSYITSDYANPPSYDNGKGWNPNTRV